MTVADGPDGEVYLPAIYAADDAAVNGCAAPSDGRPNWRETEGGPVRGVGHASLHQPARMRLPMMELGNFRFGIA